MTVRFINQRASATPGDRPHGAACDAESCTTPHSGSRAPPLPGPRNVWGSKLQTQSVTGTTTSARHCCARTGTHAQAQAASPRLTCHLPPLQCNSSRLIVGHRRSIHPSTPANVPCAVLSPGETVKLPGAVQLCGGRCRGRCRGPWLFGGKGGRPALRGSSDGRGQGPHETSKRPNSEHDLRACHLVPAVGLGWVGHPVLRLFSRLNHTQVQFQVAFCTRWLHAA
jgi:hypothetical protein